MTMSLFLVTLGVLLTAVAALSVGVVLSERKELKGSCGGPELNADCCQTCPDRPACDAVDVPKLDVPRATTKPAPSALAQVASAGPDDGAPVALPR